jgi:hypothetical protein
MIKGKQSNEYQAHIHILVTTLALSTFASAGTVNGTVKFDGQPPKGRPIDMAKERNCKVMLIGLIALAIVNAALTILYFVHLRYEPRTLFLTLIPALIFVLVMMVEMFPDSLRLYHLRSPIR